MSGTRARRAERGAIVASLRDLPPGHGTRAPLRRVSGHASRARHAPAPCGQAFGGGIDDAAIAEENLPTST